MNLLLLLLLFSFLCYPFMMTWVKPNREVIMLINDDKINRMKCKHIFLVYLSFLLSLLFIFFEGYGLLPLLCIFLSIYIFWVTGRGCKFLGVPT